MRTDLPAALRALFDALPDGVIVNHPDDGLVYANAAFFAFVARGEEILGRRALELVAPEDREVARERMRFAALTGQSTEPRALRFIRPDGSTVSGDCRGVAHTIDGEKLLVVVVRDLTDQQRAERALQESGALFRTLIEDLRVGVVVQGPSAEIRVTNRAALELLGLDEEQLLGRTSFDPEWNVVHEDGSPFPGSDHPVPSAIRTRRPVRDVLMGVYRPKRKDRVWLLVNAEPQLDAEGNVVQVVCTFSDFTERRRQQAQSAAGDRMASLGRLAAGVAHEIKNPLAYVIGQLEALCQAPLDEALAQRAREALEGAGRVRAIVDDLRSLSRGDDERLGPVDLARAIDSACNMAAPHARHRATLVRDLARVPMVTGNESRLVQLVLNLVVNAAEAIPEGHASEHEIRVRLRDAGGGRVLLEVSDSGVGIPQNVIARIFDPFFTTKRVGVGTGLGLAICHGIVVALGGEIDVESTIGKGTTFRVTLPACASLETVNVPVRAPAAPRSSILVIDDEPRVGRVLADLLAPEHDVDVETDAQAALGRIASGGRYDVIICDLMMPNMGGMDFQEVLEAQAPELAKRTVYMTGGAFTPRARAFIDRFADRSLDKPFCIDDVTRAIARVRAATSG